MQSRFWKYYNYAMIPRCPPHVAADTALLENRSFWKAAGGKALFARWITDFDCGSQTDWWYVIKDTPFDIQALKAKRRYEINKGNRNFSVRRIEPREYAGALWEVEIAAFSAYPEKYRPTAHRDRFFAGVESWQNHLVLGAFHRETGKLCGYARLEAMGERSVKFTVQRTMPDFEKFGLNAALVSAVLDYYRDVLGNGGYIFDGERSVNHETAFQDYLEKYFGFRKAYCRLHLKYRSPVGMAVGALYPLRKLLRALDGIGPVHSLNAVLTMEQIRRSCAEKEEKERPI